MTDDKKNQSQGWNTDEDQSDQGNNASENNEAFYSEIGKDTNRNRNQDNDQTEDSEDSE